jgi:hypothetical protein
MTGAGVEAGAAVPEPSALALLGGWPGDGNFLG